MIFRRSMKYDNIAKKVNKKRLQAKIVKISPNFSERFFPLGNEKNQKKN